MNNDEKWLSLIDNAKFIELFVDGLGWNRSTATEIQLTVDDLKFIATPVAQYKGIQVWSCNKLPNAKIQREIDKAISKVSTERLTIFHDGIFQNWRWPMSRESSGNGITRLISHEHIKGQKTVSLLQRLQLIQIELESHEPNLVEMLVRLRKAFDADQVTKKFYREFSEYQKSLVTEITGLKSIEDREWYSSLLLNRIMFIYFMQWKGFMDGNQNYLADSLDKISNLKGPNQFYSFFRDFLLPLFHKGLGAGEKIGVPPEITEIVGRIPYINGGIFSQHELEAKNEVNIPDKAFAEIFGFFDNYQWHLDSRRTGNPKEINPDVLGYVFEQFVNNKEVGAYYTKEDITDYMTNNTLLITVIQKIKEGSSINVLLPLVQNPERYIWPSLKYGEENINQIPVESNISNMERKSPSNLGLPGETFWETSRRFKYLKSLRNAIDNGEITQVSDLVTWNLDLETLLVDLIDGIDTSDDVIRIWQILSELRVVDPTCGSGAFLFAALNQLESIYSVLLDVAEIHAKTGINKALNNLLSDIAKHPNRQYFILKHASQKNLFGVDLMREATEIARLRLFLKLISSIDEFEDIEPLPDLEFNIKSGNLLIGITQSSNLVNYISTLDASQKEEEIYLKRDHLAELWDNFLDAQEQSHAAATKAKKLLNSGIIILRDTLDELFYKGTKSDAEQSFTEWRIRSSPFHWFIEFPAVFKDGGFDVVLGNPPYISRNKINYSLEGHITSDSPDIYAMCMERSCQLTKSDGTYGMIVMSSLVFSSKYSKLREVLSKRFKTRYISGYAKIPAALFEGVKVRNTIFIGLNFEDKLYSAPMHRWIQDYRPHLMSLIRYNLVGKDVDKSLQWPFVTSKKISDGLRSHSGTLKQHTLARGPELSFAPRKVNWDKSSGKMVPLFYKTNAYNRISASILPPPVEDEDGNAASTSAQKFIWFRDEESRKLVFTLFNSKWMFAWWAMYGDDLNVTQDNLLSFPASLEIISVDDKKILLSVAEQLHEKMIKKVKWKKNAGLQVGSWDISECREELEKIDFIWAKILSLDSILPELYYQYFSTVKTSSAEIDLDISEED
jgi:hypothetical protein